MKISTLVSSLLHPSIIVVAKIFLYIRFINLFNSSVINFFCLIGRLNIIYRGVIILIVNFLRSFYRILFLIFHAFFKSLLFLISGLFIHESNRNQNISKINVFNSKLSSYSFIVSLLSLIRIPFISRFFSKDLILENIWREFINCFIIFIFFFLDAIYYCL